MTLSQKLFLRIVIIFVILVRSLSGVAKLINATTKPDLSTPSQLFYGGMTLIFVFVLWLMTKRLVRASALLKTRDANHLKLMTASYALTAIFCIVKIVESYYRFF